MDVSILIVSFNTLAMTRACLESLYRETTEVEYEVIVVDNASADGSARMIAREFPQARLHALEENVGFGRANNLAAIDAQGDYVLLLNSDTVVLDHAIDKLVAFARMHPQAGVYGGRSLFGDGRLNPQSVWGNPSLWSELCVGLGLSVVFPRSKLFNPRYLGSWQRDSERRVDIVSGSYLLMDVALWKALGGFDERFFMYGEDVDLCLRAKQLGYHCLFTPDSEIIHHGGGSEKIAADKMIRLFRAKAQLYHKHWPPLGARIGIVLLDLWVATRLVTIGALSWFRPGFRPAATKWRKIWASRAQWHLSGDPAATPQPTCLT